jgi:dihydrofolate reductase
MRRLCYSVAMSLDGFIAGPKGEADWIVMDPDLGPSFTEFFSRFDTLLIGRKTFQAMGGKAGGGPPGFPKFTVAVCSTTLKAADYPGVTFISEDLAAAVTRMKGAPGKDIWIFGGGALFRSLLTLGLVDSVRVGVIPALLGGGIPLLPWPAPRTTLRLTEHHVYPKTGTVLLEYAIEPPKRPTRKR